MRLFIRVCATVPQWIPKSSQNQLIQSHRSSPPGSAYQSCTVASRKQGPHFSLFLCACQSCQVHTESAFIRTTVEHFYIDIFIGGSLATTNNRPPWLIISKSEEKSSQVRISFHMTRRERKEYCFKATVNQRDQLHASHRAFILRFPH